MQNKPLSSKLTMKNFLDFLKKFYIYFVLIIIYVPLIFIVLLSFNGQTERGNINVNFTTPTFVNYLELFNNNEFVNALLNSLLLGVCVTPISLIIAICTCLGIWRAKKYQRNTIMLLSKTSIVNPEAITGISLVLLFASTWIALGFDFGFFTVLLAHISFCTPYAIAAIYPRVMKMNPNQILASYDLGHSKISTFFKITIPYLLPAIISAAIIVFSISLDDFIITNLVNGSFQTIGTAIYTTRKGIKAWVVTFGAIVVLIAIAIIIGISVHKTIRQKRAKVKKIITSNPKN